MLAFVNSQPHLGISKRLDHFCDEATFVDWEAGQPGSAGLADQLAAHHRRRHGGHADPAVPGEQHTRVPAASRGASWLKYTLEACDERRLPGSGAIPGAG
jgi:hypothetical protein